MKTNEEEYRQWIISVKQHYRNSQIKAAVHVNCDMLEFYWFVGRDLCQKQFLNTYGSGFYKQVSADLQRELPDVKGLSPTNIKYFKYFYDLYSPLRQNRPQLADESSNENVPQLADNLQTDPNLAQLALVPWDHHRRIIDKCKDNPQKAFFYVMKTIENNWSRAMLLNFLDTNLFEREGKAVTNFRSTLPVLQGDLATQMLNDPYNFDFLTMREHYDEKELKDALMDNIQKFLLELGNGFAFVGREVRIAVGNTEKFIDMLFYNIKLHCYMVLEVKTDKFDFANIGQLGGYIVAVNHQLKGENDNPTIGLLVCKYKDNIEAQYALESSSQPVGISAYELSKLIPDNFKSSLPSIEEIEKDLANHIHHKE